MSLIDRIKRLLGIKIKRQKEYDSIIRAFDYLETTLPPSLASTLWKVRVHWILEQGLPFKVGE